ncbi:MAG TPA: hypothetical protein VIX19_06080 [Terriglobales bacterium]
MSAIKTALIFGVLLVSAAGFAQSTNCDEGAGLLNPAPPKNGNTQQIIDNFAAREAVFKQARNNYTFTQDIMVQELDGNTVTGDFRLVEDIIYDDKGARLENVTFAPQPTLRQLSLSKEDYEDFRNKMPFVMTTEDVPKYNLLYVGEQHVDEIDTFVFDVAPKTIEKGQRYFQGRLWVDSRDFQIVKTCGKTVPEVRADSHKKRNVQENLMPKFVTYREQIDGEYWFPTYTRAEDVLHFRTGDVHMREIIKYTNYKRFGSTTKIVFKGEVKDNNNAPPAKKP